MTPQHIQKLRAGHQTNPYAIETPALISFSGGRTSGYLLWHILDAFDGRLPVDAHVVFFNTGKEREETLAFVQRCATEWNVRIRWLEYASDWAGKTREVSHNSASRNGEPFEAVIAAKGGYLPNITLSYCSAELKVKRGIVFMRDWCNYKHWTNAIGIRADEPRRVAKTRLRNNTGKERFETVLPLAEAVVSARDVVSWWRWQPFDLALPAINGRTPSGNCDLCFKKRLATKVGLIRSNPVAADWWIEQENRAEERYPDWLGRFRKDQPAYSEMKRIALSGDLFDPPENDIDMPCACHD